MFPVAFRTLTAVCACCPHKWQFRDNAYVIWMLYCILPMFLWDFLILETSDVKVTQLKVKHG